MLLQTTLSLAAAAAIINFWIGIRCGQVRHAQKILHGDGGSPLMIRRMRAHANFIENAPIFLILAGLIEMTGKGGQWLAIVGALFMIGRVTHAIGMDKDTPNALRGYGVMSAMLSLVGLAVVAVLIALGRM